MCQHEWGLGSGLEICSLDMILIESDRDLYVGLTQGLDLLCQLCQPHQVLYDRAKMYLAL